MGIWYQKCVSYMHHSGNLKMHMFTEVLMPVAFHLHAWPQHSSSCYDLSSTP